VRLGRPARLPARAWLLRPGQEPAWSQQRHLCLSLTGPPSPFREPFLGNVGRILGSAPWLREMRILYCLWRRTSLEKPQGRLSRPALAPLAAMEAAHIADWICDDVSAGILGSGLVCGDPSSSASACAGRVPAATAFARAQICALDWLYLFLGGSLFPTDGSILRAQHTSFGQIAMDRY
jgi:hypothetical protein